MPINREHQVYRSYAAPLKNVPAWRLAKTARYRSLVAGVLDQETRMKELPDEELRRLGQQYRQEVINGRDLDSLLIGAFALAREVSRRVLGMTHFPVQVLGGIGLHYGHIIEAATGEGKTLLATLPVYLNALTERGVHVVTVNDYLARRDAEEMGKIYRYLGLTVGVVVNDMNPAQRTRAYRCSITYATNKEVGFDYLRDTLRGRTRQWFEFGMSLDFLRAQRVQRPDPYFAIVDEADSILIDEARTPLIIADAPPADDEMVDEYRTADRTVAQLQCDVDFTYDPKEKRIEWLRAGEQKLTRVLGGRRGLTGHRIDWHESCMRALKAHIIFKRDVDYVIDDGEIVIVDESTGRKMPGRQWEEGLHQAVAAKEGLEIKAPTETLARTTYQILFNRYEKLSGMTGTAMPSALELAEVFGLGTLKIPTNRPCLRKLYPDLIFGSEQAKWAAVVEQVRALVAAGRAVLVGTRSIEASERLSAHLESAEIAHVILNARHEAKEAAIVSEAGKPGKVTVATNMAGRGTDIKLDPSVAASGGLHVIGTERHESQRIDLQLIGRCARQGDPGTAQFLVSVEDPLIQRYRPKQSKRLMERYGDRPDPIPGAAIRRFFRGVQRSIERQHRKIRNQLIKYERERTKYNRELGTE